MKNYNRIIVIGGGPAGMMAAISAAGVGAGVVLYEKNMKLGKKLRITGKGRCNVTNNCPPSEILRSVTKNYKFLYGAINRFSPEDVMTFFEKHGVALKTERGRRVFPVSDDAHDIADAMETAMNDVSVRIIHENITGILYYDGHVSGVKCGQTIHPCSAVIVATGGVSYQGTGSTGDGFRFAGAAGLEVIKPLPSLVPVETKEDTTPLAGLTLKNVTLSVVECDSGKTVYEEMGELLFAHFGLTGPLVLSASAHMRSFPPDGYILKIDLKPALDEATLDARLISDLAKYSARDFINSLHELLPQKLIGEVIDRCAFDPRKKSGEITKTERRALLSVLKGLTYTPKAFRSINEAVVTSGGVAVGELSPKTMMAKRIDGLFFAGEVIDVDAYTGGYNLQLAFSTGYLAGLGAAEYISEINLDD